MRGEGEVLVSCLTVELLYSIMNYLSVGSCEALEFGILWETGEVQRTAQWRGMEKEEERLKRDKAKQDRHT